jgi:hypothetical protein
LNQNDAKFEQIGVRMGKLEIHLIFSLEIFWKSEWVTDLVMKINK